MSEYKETNRRIEVQGEQELSDGVIKFNYKAENASVAPDNIFFSGMSGEVKFRGNFDVRRDSFGFTEEGGEVEPGVRTTIRETLVLILSDFTLEE